MTADENVARCDREGCDASAPLTPWQSPNGPPPFEEWASTATYDDDGNLVRVKHFCPDHPPDGVWLETQARRLGLPPFHRPDDSPD